jgi:hypothetical protein
MAKAPNPKSKPQMINSLDGQPDLGLSCRADVFPVSAFDCVLSLHKTKPLSVLLPFPRLKPAQTLHNLPYGGLS